MNHFKEIMSDRSDFPAGSTDDKDVSRLYETFKKGKIGYRLQCPNCENQFEIEQKSGRIEKRQKVKMLRKIHMSMLLVLSVLS